jgi:CheY-like chemotaxis protein
VARELRAHADSKRLRLTLDLPAQAVYAQGEELLCYSTLANLLKNALEASPEDGEVLVRLRSQSDGNGDCVALDIHNDGQVPEALRERFFEKYATHGKADGTGLGAYSARLMARVQRGALRMNSDEGGTTLSLRLPLWHAAPPVSAGPAMPKPEPGTIVPLPAVSVLVVDDDEYNVVVLKNLLPSPPLTVRTAVNGLAALACVRESPPDIIFMDLEMPVLGGVEAVRRIRALEQEQGAARSFIAAFSAHDDDATRSACVDAGFDVYLAKPASREEVVAVLRRQDPALVVARPGSPGPARVEPAMLALLPQFLDSRRSMAQELAFAVREGERDKVRDTAHKLAGSLAMYGFRDASRASRDLERAASTEDIARLQARCAQLARMLSDVQPQREAGS